MFTLAVFILAVPSLTSAMHTPAESHERTVSVVVSVVMLALFALSLPGHPREQGPGSTVHAGHGHSPNRSPIAASKAIRPRRPVWLRRTASGRWPLAIGMLAVAGIGAAFVWSGSSPHSNRPWRPPASTRCSPVWSSWPSPATRWRTSSVSSLHGQEPDGLRRAGGAAVARADRAHHRAHRLPGGGVARAARLRSRLLAAASGCRDDGGTGRRVGDVRRGVALVQASGLDRVHLIATAFWWG